jgi:hypothetical protein
VRRATKHGEEVFFFEEKNQKTFAPAPASARASSGRPCVAPRDKSFLVLFFKKENVLFTCLDSLSALG